MHKNNIQCLIFFYVSHDKIIFIKLLLSDSDTETGGIRDLLGSGEVRKC